MDVAHITARPELNTANSCSDSSKLLVVIMCHNNELDHVEQILKHHTENSIEPISYKSSRPNMMIKVTNYEHLVVIKQLLTGRWNRHFCQLYDRKLT